MGSWWGYIVICRSMEVGLWIWKGGFSDEHESMALIWSWSLGSIPYTYHVVSVRWSEENLILIPSYPIPTPTSHQVRYPAGPRIEGHLIFSISPLSQTPPFSTMTSSSKLPKIPQIPEITLPFQLSYLYLQRISHTTNLPGKRSLDLELWTRAFTLDLGQGVIMIPKEVVW
jgi:hypothetical protein